MEQLFFAFVARIIISIKNSKLAPPRRNFWIRLRFNSATERGQWWREKLRLYVVGGGVMIGIFKNGSKKVRTVMFLKKFFRLNNNYPFFCKFKKNYFILHRFGTALALVGRGGGHPSLDTPKLCSQFFNWMWSKNLCPPIPMGGMLSIPIPKRSFLCDMSNSFVFLNFKESKVLKFHTFLTKVLNLSTRTQNLEINASLIDNFPANVISFQRLNDIHMGNVHRKLSD